MHALLLRHLICSPEQPARALPLRHTTCTLRRALSSGDYVYDRLMEAGLQSVPAEDALAMVQDGRAVLVDVRPR